MPNHSFLSISRIMAVSGCKAEDIGVFCVICAISMLDDGEPVAENDPRLRAALPESVLPYDRLRESLEMLAMRGVIRLDGGKIEVLVR